GFGESDMTVELLDTADKEGVAVSEIRAGENLYFDNDKLMIEVLSPERSLGVVTHDLNELSLILMVRYRDLEVLICGDATAENENLLVSTGKKIKADIYRISHHGSPRSTGDDIINAVAAEVAVISVGYNSYGHPSDIVISRLAESGAEVLRTDHNGAVIIRYNGIKAAIKTMIP
ncbi:MAG: MBL fold metallo-hydrolase, partial [Saccharofermentanales bacterium]